MKKYDISIKDSISGLEGVFTEVFLGTGSVLSTISFVSSFWYSISFAIRSLELYGLHFDIPPVATLHSTAPLADKEETMNGKRQSAKYFLDIT